MADSKMIEGPAGYVGGMTPSGAEKLPVKEYPGSKFVEKGSKGGMSIDSPACKDGYTKR